MGYTNTKTGKTVKPKPSFTVEDRIPPFLPLNWMDWESDPHVLDMTESMEGVYLRLIIYQWKYGSFPFDYSKMARLLRVHDQRNMRKFLERYGHLFRCVECGGIPPKATGNKSSERAHGMLTACPYCAYAVSDSCSSGARGLSIPCSCNAPSVLNEKLKNYSFDVKNGLSLGTTEPNPNPNSNKFNLYSSLAGEGEGEVAEEEIEFPDGDEYDELA